MENPGGVEREEGRGVGNFLFADKRKKKKKTHSGAWPGPAEVCMGVEFLKKGKKRKGRRREITQIGRVTFHAGYGGVSTEQKKKIHEKGGGGKTRNGKKPFCQEAPTAQTKRSIKLNGKRERKFKGRGDKKRKTDLTKTT